MIFAKIGFCIVLMVMATLRFFKGGKKLSEAHMLLIAAGLVLVVLPQEFIKSKGVLHVIDILGLIITLIGVSVYVVMKFLKKSKKPKEEAGAKGKENKEKKH